jgi:hypothetical protein
MGTDQSNVRSDMAASQPVFSEREEAVMKVLGHLTSQTIAEDKGRMELANKSITHTLYQHILGQQDAPAVPQAVITPPEKQQMGVLHGYVNLASLRFTIRNCEYYFKRYPFAGLPLNRADHLRNICEMFFDRIVQFRDRLKATLNAIRADAPHQDIPVGKLLKSFDRMFDSVIRLRNQVHHSNRYDDHLIEQLNLISLLRRGENFPIPLPDEEMLFRRAAKVSSKRVQDHAAAIDGWCDTVAGLILDHCAFAKVALVATDAKEVTTAEASAG